MITLSSRIRRRSDVLGRSLWARAVLMRRGCCACAQRRFLYKELQFELTATQATIDAECELPDTATADATLRELKARLARLEERRAAMK